MYKLECSACFSMDNKNNTITHSNRPNFFWEIWVIDCSDLRGMPPRHL